VILAANGLPKRWLENDGRIDDLTEAKLKERQFYSYEAVFGNGTDRVFNVNQALDVLSKSVSVNRNGALCVDYSVVIPVLVNTLDELNVFFAALTKSRLRQLLGECVEQVFAAQRVVSEIGAEIAQMQELRSANDQAQVMDGGLVVKHLSAVLRERYAKLPLHITQGADIECFVPPTFDLYESAAEKERTGAETVLDFTELLQSDLTVCRLCIKGQSGSGKTTVCRYIAREWAKGRTIFSGKFDLVFYLSLDAATTQAYDDLAQVTLVDLVMREIVGQSDQLKSLFADKEELHAWLTSNSHRILWVLDGLDALEDTVDNVFSAKPVASAAATSSKSPRDAVAGGDDQQRANSSHNVKVKCLLLQWLLV
jgi:hypothetical protein